MGSATTGNTTGIVQVESTRLHSRVHLTDHFINPVMSIINEDTWQSLTSRQQDWVVQAMEAARELCDRLNLENEARLVAYFEEQGMDIIEPDKDAFRTYALDTVMGDDEITST